MTLLEYRKGQIRAAMALRPGEKTGEKDGVAKDTERYARRAYSMAWWEQVNKLHKPVKERIIRDFRQVNDILVLMKKSRHRG